MPTRLPPTDPMIASSWHVRALSVDKVWSEYSGAGTSTGVYDDGIQTNHEDLASRIDTSKEVVVGSTRYASSLGTAQHGTAVAGIIGAAADNAVGGAGISFGTKLTGVTILGSAGPDFITAMHAMDRFHTTNHSWGWVDKFVDSKADSFGASFLAGLKDAVDTGRGGLGTIVVNAAGNDWDYDRRDANTSQFSASRFSITVAATSSNGDVSYYSNRGASILVAGAGDGISTTDRMGTSGYASGNYMSNFGGTSAATPTVSGVVNLMHEASANRLGWRDVQDILAITADHTTPTALTATAVAGEGAFRWTINKADTVDGGGMHFSNDVGFGRVDAYEAVRMAEVWSRFGSARTSANEQVASASGTTSAAIRDNATASFSFAVGAQLEIEHVDLTLTLSHGDLNDLRIELVSAEGTVSEVLTPGWGAVTSVSNFTWSFGSEAFRGEHSAGTWTVRVTDTLGGYTGSLSSWSFEAFGRAASADDVYHYTDDFLALRGTNAARGVLQDGGGSDWINMAAIDGPVVANLSGSVTVGGTKWFDVATGTVMEHIVTGDGNDVITGNGSANKLVGMRGNDRLAGRAGSDTLDGGAGIDTADYSASGAAVDVDFTRSVQYGGDASGDLFISMENLDGSGFSDRLNGSDGANLIRGFNGNDHLAGRGGADTLDGGAGADTVSYWVSTGGVDVDLNRSVQSGAHATGDQLFSIENLNGSNHGDRLAGNAGANFIQGFNGNDTLVGRGGADTLNGGGGTDTVSYQGSAAVDVDLSRQTQIGGDAAGDRLAEIENVIGSAFNDVLAGKAGTNVLTGGAGADVFRFVGAFGADVVSDFVQGVDKLAVVGRSFGQLSFEASGADKLIRIAGVGDTIRLTSGASLTLGTSDFQFA